MNKYDYLWKVSAELNIPLSIELNIRLSPELAKKQAIDYFTDTAAILNKFDLRSIIGCPGGMSTFCLYFRALFGIFFLKVFLE